MKKFEPQKGFDPANPSQTDQSLLAIEITDQKYVIFKNSLYRPMRHTRRLL